jgi:pilus assembly protein Flp/PilA
MVKLFVTLESFVAFARERMREEKGATAVEYGLMVGLIAVVIIVAVTALGGELRDLFQAIVDRLPAAPAA